MSIARTLFLGISILATAAFSFAAETKPKAPAEKPAEKQPAPAADKPAETPKPAAPAADPRTAGLKVEGETVKMPVFTVSAERMREIDHTIKGLEKQISREKKQLEKSNLDEALNNEKIAKAASIFGGKSTVQRASVAAVRIDSMEKELQLLETLRTPLTKSDRAMIEQLVEEQRTYRRNLDDALR